MGLPGVIARLALVAALALAVPACSDNDPPATATASLVASSSAAPTTTTTRLPPDLQSVVDAFVGEQKVPFSVVAVDLSTGARATHLSDRQVRSASLYKLYVARELLRRIYAGTLRRDAPASDGEGRTVDECLRAMIVVSDNACGVAGLSIVGRGEQNAALRRDGFVNTSLASPQLTSADDVALFFMQARDGTLLGPDGGAASAELYQLLREQQVNDRLPLDLPPQTPIAHKTGDINEWAHDAGVITTPHGDVLLAVLSGPWPLPCCDADHPGEPERIAFGAIAELGRAVFDAASR
ncbi:MAG: beta-lactamase class [Acidimicrobiaceae bacterium]